MKKLLRLIIALFALALLCATWLANANAGSSQTPQTATMPELTEYTITAESPEPTTEPTPVPTEEPCVPAGEPQECPWSGEWVVDVDKSDYSALIQAFGTSFRDYGSLMVISPSSGELQFYIGITGYEGTFVMEGDFLSFTGASVNDATYIRNFTFTPSDNGNITYLVVQVDGISVYWTQK